MAKKKSWVSAETSEHDDSAAVDMIIEHLEPAAKAVVGAIRKLI